MRIAGIPMSFDVVCTLTLVEGHLRCRQGGRYRNLGGPRAAREVL